METRFEQDSAPKDSSATLSVSEVAVYTEKIFSNNIIPLSNYNKKEYELLDIESEDDLEKLYEILAKSVADNNSQQLVPTFTIVKNLSLEANITASGVCFYQDKVAIWNYFNDHTIFSMVYVFDLTNGKLLDKYRHDDSFTAPGYDGTRVFVENDFPIYTIHHTNGCLILGGLSRDKRDSLVVLNLNEPGPLSLSFCFSDEPYGHENNGVRAIVSLNGYIVVGSVAKIEVFTLSAKYFLKKAFEVKINREEATCLAVSERNGWVSAGFSNGVVRFYELQADGQLSLLREWQAHKSYVDAITFLKDGSLASGGRENWWFFQKEHTIQIWNPHNGEKEACLSLVSDRDYTKQLVALPNGWLCSRSSKNQAIIWNVRARKKELIYSSVLCVALSDADHLALIYSGRIYFIHLAAPTSSPYFRPDFKTLLPVHRKFYLFQLHNCLKQCLKHDDNKVNLANLDLTDDNVSDVLKLLKYNKSVTDLDLSYNNFTYNKELANLFQHTNLPLIKLRLAGNNIDSLAFTYLMDSLHQKDVKELYLQNNIINYDKASLERVKRASSLKMVDLSNNFLQQTHLSHNFPQPGDDSLYKDDPHKTKLRDGGYYRFSIFRMKSASNKDGVKIKSRIDPNKSLTHSLWVISLSCHKQGQHAMILLEGMRENGQLFIERYHIRIDRRFYGEATIRVGYINPTELDSSVLCSISTYIDKNKGEELSNSLKKRHQHKENFAFTPLLGFMQAKKPYNCLEWCIKELKAVEIEIEAPILAFLPRTVASKGKIRNLILSQENHSRSTNYDEFPSSPLK